MKKRFLFLVLVSFTFLFNFLFFVSAAAGGPNEPSGTTQIFYIDGTTKNWGAGNGFAWGPLSDGSTGITGTGTQGTFTRTTGTWNTNEFLNDPYGSYATIVDNNFNLIGVFPVTSNTGNTVNLIGDATGGTRLFGGRVGIVNDPQAPNGKAVNCFLPAGSSSGFQGCRTDLNMGGLGYREIYIRTVMKFNSNWEQHPSSSVTKLFYYGTSVHATSFYPAARGSSPSMQWRDQSAADDDGVFRHGTTFPWGSYHEIEIHHVMESSDGAGDGYVKMWIDGNRVNDPWSLTGSNGGPVNLGDPQWSWHNGARFFRAQMGVYWGGSGDSRTHDNWYRWGEVYISGCSTNCGGGGGDTTPPFISNPSPSGTLSAGTTQTTMSATTNEAATCKWHTSDISYASMSNTFSTTGSTSHSTTLTGLTNGTSYTRYVRCQDGSGNANTASTTVSFSVASPSDTTPPVRSNGQPSGNLSAGTDEVTLEVTTDETSICRYGTTSGTAYGSIPNTFETTGSTSHSQIISGLTDGTIHNYYVRCNDSSGNINANDFTISFAINPTGTQTFTFDYDWNEWNTAQTTNLSQYSTNQLQNISNVKFVNSFGTIHYLQNLNLSQNRDLRHKIKVLARKIWINSSLIPEFNKSAQLTFNNVTLDNPIIKVDGQDCPASKCQNITFNETSGTYTVNIIGFSVYEVVDQCSDGIKNFDETGKDCGGKCGECRGVSGWVWLIIIAGVGVVVWFVFNSRRKSSRKRRGKRR